MDIEDEQLHIENQSALWAAEGTAGAARVCLVYVVCICVCEGYIHLFS